METVNEMLNFNFSFASFQQRSKNVFPANNFRLYESKIEKLKKITEDVGETTFKFSGQKLIPQVYKKFKLMVEGKGLDNKIFEQREIRTLTYSLSYSEYGYQKIFTNGNELDLIFEILEVRWKDSYLVGLIDCYLKNWEPQHKVSLVKLGKYIFGKLREYEGGRTILKSFKTNFRFFGENGDVILGRELAIGNKHIKEATKYLSLPGSWFVYPYFSKVIVEYYEKRKNDIKNFIDDLGVALSEHGNSISNKRLLSKLIMQANENEFAHLQDKVKSIAFNLIGDPGNASYWLAFENATENEKGDLKTARDILNEWIARQFINVFFEKCINDARRKKFWLKYVKEIRQFRVVGSQYTKTVLLADDRINEYVTPRFSNTNSSRDNNAALMFIMKNHLFIEFSDEGAFYAYKLSNPNAPSIDAPHFNSTGSLKTPSMKWLLYHTGKSVNEIYDEGRLGHNDGGLGWELIAGYWLKEKAGINV